MFHLPTPIVIISLLYGIAALILLSINLRAALVKRRYIELQKIRNERFKKMTLGLISPSQLTKEEFDELNEFLFIQYCAECGKDEEEISRTYWKRAGMLDYTQWMVEWFTQNIDNTK